MDGSQGPAAGTSIAPLPPPAQGSATTGWKGLDQSFHAAQLRGTSGLSPFGLSLAFMDWAAHFANAPFHRAELGQSAATQWRRLWGTLSGQPAIAPARNDHRFNAPAWQSMPFSFAQQAFLLAEEWWGQATTNIAGTSRTSERIVSFATRQILDMLSPSNLPWFNPEVIEATVTTGGKNLQQGYRNALMDLQEAMGAHPARQDNLQVGRDLATTPGKVVFRNDLIELIQYSPTTDQVRPEPVLIVPAWIMKYYILDLSPRNSLIAQSVAQGHTVFAISWRNPGADMRDLTLDDYRKSVMAALDAVTEICQGAKVHGCGYCLGGTLLAVTAAAMSRDGDDRLASMTLFCAQTDFTEAGELQLFITEDQIAFLEDLMNSQGYLDSRQMAGAFQLLRSNDLIWSRAIKSYLLGQPEHPNDLMSWNADGTRMPARMHSEYLRHMFLNNDLAEGRFQVESRPISVGDIHVPCFVVSTETDHIAPWHSVYKIHLLNSGDITFVLVSGGHNAGVVSEPGHPHRHYRIARRQPNERYRGPEEWAATAEPHEGSWWPEWWTWLDKISGPTAPPPAMGSKTHAPLADAPGSYVLEQ